MAESKDNNSELIVLEFVHKGTEGPTIDTQTKAYLVEIHFDEKKHLVRLPSELAIVIPTFSILRLKTVGQFTC